MGSTSIGRAVGDAGGWVADRAGIGGNTGEMLRDPGRIFNAVATGGITETGQAVDKKYFTDPRNKQQDMAKSQEAAANKQIDELEEMKRQQKLTKERDIGRARARAMSANSGGRTSTILTNPSAYSAGLDSSGGRKQLLGM